MSSPSLPHFGRPFSRLTPEQVEALRAEHRRSRFNINAKERELGLGHGSLGYHLRGGKAARLRTTLGAA